MQYVRLLTATVNDPIVTTTNGWILSNTARGAISSGAISPGAVSGP